MPVEIYNQDDNVDTAMSDKTVVIGEYHPWDSVIRVGSHHYARLFLRAGWRVGYVSHPISPIHAVRPANKFRFRNWLVGGSSLNGLLAYVPLTLLPYLNVPGLRSPYVARNSLKFCVPHLRKVLDVYGLGDVKLILISDPLLGGLSRIVRHECFALRIHDEMSGFPSSPSTMRQVIEELTLEADVVFATGKRLCEDLRRLRRDVVYLPNGCEYHHFATPVPAPPEYENIPPPRVIYVGALAEWFDVQLISQVAARLSDVSFVLVGPIRCDTKALQALQNVYVLGPRPYAAVPAYMQHADAGIIPFVKSSLTDRVSPIKLFEYCAAGLPVVMTDLWEAGRYANEEFALKAFTAGDFVALLRTAIARKHELEDSCRAFARSNSWENRLATLMATIGEMDQS